MANNEDLYVSFYNPAKIAFSDMSDGQLIDKIAELEKLALQAKATLNAARDSQREKRAKLKVQDKDWLKTSAPSQAETDAINAVKDRKDRMSKLDKQVEAWQKMGLPSELIERLARDMQARATDKTLTATTNELKGESKTTIPARETTNDESENRSNVIPFDPKKLFG